MKKFITVSIFLCLPLMSEVIISKYDNGIVKKKSNKLKGLREGSTLAYYKSSSLKSETIFKHDSRDGLAKGYYDDGSLKYEKLYKNGALMGQSKTYYENGALKSDFVFEDDIPVSGNKYLPNGDIIK